MAPSLSARDILRLRLRALLVEPAAGDRPTPAGVVDRLLAVQAQDWQNALWAVGLRAPGSTRSEVLSALAGGEIVRTLPMRGTLHLIAARDAGWMLDLTAERTLASVRTRLAQLQIDDAMVDRASDIVTEALRGGGRLSRAEFGALLAERGIPTDGQRAYHLIFVLCQRQVLVWGPPAASQQHLVLFDEWIPVPRRQSREESLRELALRYVQGHGPVTVRDLAWWAKLTLADARLAVALAGDGLEAAEHEGQEYLLPAGASVRSSAAQVHLLPGFDEFLLGYQDRSLALAAEHVQRVIPGVNGIFQPIVVAADRVAGVWRRGGETGVAAELFAPSAAIEAGVGRAATRYARFMAA
ncbi:DNA glycosylase AlkZ-like family protein [Galbitalea soli]|uniref:Winged helix DNA-binding domain-containing protein n=1 Tax=Galbitalea soli TaxID=1268042 RepID=A0A7C9PNR8_9MICO|nr:winged helix DNA-binding domain-containing protein [Galbitalea soli]NYJ30303.1 hypothetical protein [Galbitalea soli]